MSEQAVYTADYYQWHRYPGYWADVTHHFPPNAELLDIGCGIGWLAEFFRAYTGIDGSVDAVRIATELGRNVIEGNIEESLPFADESFDAIIMKDVLEHIADPGALVAEALRVLRPDGVVFASSPDAQRWVWDDYTHRRPFTRKSFRLLFADQGFDVQQASYESVVPGVGVISARTRRKRRPRVFNALAHMPFHRRNVWVLARRPA